MKDKKRHAPVARQQPLEEEDFPRGGANSELTPLDRRQLTAQAQAEVEAGDIAQPEKKQRVKVLGLMVV